MSDETMPRLLLRDGEISISANDLMDVLDGIGWNTYPRSVGNPQQRYAHDAWGVFELLVESNHKPEHGKRRTAFISHNRYSKNEHHKKVLPVQIEIGTMMFDFDSGILEKSYTDVKKLYRYLTKQGVPSVVIFTGSKGFHLHASLVPKQFRFKYQDGSAEAIKTIVRQVQRFFKEKLNLETMDEAVVGEPKKLARIPYSWHVSRTGVNSKRICVPLPPSMLELDIEKIVEYSMNPRLYVPRLSAPKETILELASRLKLKEAIASEKLVWQQSKDTIIDVEGELIGVLELFKKKCPGWYADLQHESRNPMHPTRFGFAIFCKTLGYGPHDVDTFWKQLGSKMKYIDNDNDEYRMEQILSLFQPRYRKPASCTTIKRQRRGEESLCIGPACYRYKEAEK